MEGELKKISVKCVCLMSRQLTEGNTLAEGSPIFGLSRGRAGVLLMANLIIYFELWQRKEENRCASGAKTLEIF